jgi:hypothetical protein
MLDGFSAGSQQKDLGLSVLAWKTLRQANILGVSEECLKSVVHVLLDVAVKQR